MRKKAEPSYLVLLYVVILYCMLISYLRYYAFLRVSVRTLRSVSTSV